VPQPSDDPAGSWTGEWDILAGQARRAGRTALISHELLAGATSEQTTRAIRSLQPAEVHIVVTVRDLASLLPAEWQETVKHRNQRPWDRWLAAIVDQPAPNGARASWFWKAHDTVDVLRRWSLLVPPERVHVVTVPPSGSSPDLLWQRFASVLGLDAGRFDTSAARPNASLGLPEVEMLRRLNRTLASQIPSWFYAGRVKETLAHVVLAQRTASGRLRLPEERHAWAHERADALIAELLSSGYDIVGDLNDLRPQPTREPGLDPKDVSDAQVLDAALSGLAALLRIEYDTGGTSPRRTAANGLEPRRPGVDRARRLVRALSTRHRAIARMRVLAWGAAERSRGNRLAGR
jgi:hypothetical protein